MSEDSGWKLIANQHSLPASMFSVAAIQDFSSKRFILKNGVTVIGRDSSCCDVALPGSHVSRRHAELTVQGKQLHVKDLGSSNGTFVNEAQVSESLIKVRRPNSI